MGYKISDTARRFDGTPVQLSALPEGKPVTAGEALKTVTENYGRCNANRIKLESLQDWVRQMQKVDDEASARSEFRKLPYFPERK